jgi:hypothetical protein
MRNVRLQQRATRTGSGRNRRANLFCLTTQVRAIEFDRLPDRVFANPSVLSMAGHLGLNGSSIDPGEIFFHRRC